MGGRAVELVHLALPGRGELLDVRGVAREARCYLRAVLEDDTVVEDPATLRMDRLVRDRGAQEGGRPRAAGTDQARLEDGDADRRRRVRVDARRDGVVVGREAAPVVRKRDPDRARRDMRLT